jgi:hypothetical protein
MRCSLVAALVVLVAALVLGAGCTTTRAYTRDQLQARVAPRFPVEKRRSLFVVRMSNPQLAFAGERLSLALDLDATAAVWTTHGHAVVEGGVEYRAEDGAIFLRDPTVRTLDFDRVPPEWREPLRVAAEQLLVAQLAERPLYTLDSAHGGDEARARKHLRRVWIADDRLMLLLGS